jgi:glutamyl-tRNA synthetase
LIEMVDGLKMFYQDFDKFDEKLSAKQFKDSQSIGLLLTKLSALDDWTATNIKEQIKQVCDELDIGFGKIGQPFRLALSGNGNAGNIDVVAQLVGKNRTLGRLQMALDYITQHSH